jgi:hypothetical protein
MTQGFPETPARSLLADSLRVTQALMLRAREIDLRGAEADNSEESHESLFHAAQLILRDTYESMKAIAGNFDRGDVDAGGLEETVANVATLARLALHERLDSFRHSAPCDHWSFIEKCESTLRSVWKATSALERALTPSAPNLRIYDAKEELTRGLAIRIRYARLHEEVRAARAAQDSLSGCLQAVSRSLATLLSSPEFPTMRLGDRFEIRRFQLRIQSWLSSEHRDELTGERLWQEGNAVVSLLRGVNRRYEIFEHDAAVLTELLAILAASDDLDGARKTAAALSGLDSELDRLLDVRTRDGNQRGRWLSTIERLASEKGISIDSSSCESVTTHTGH